MAQKIKNWEFYVFYDLLTKKKYFITNFINFMVFYSIFKYFNKFFAISIFFFYILALFLSSRTQIVCSKDNEAGGALKSLKKPILQHPFGIISLFSYINFPRFKKLGTERVKLGKISLDVLENKNSQSTIIFVHGFSSNSEAVSILNMMGHLKGKYRCVSLNYRGCCCSPLLCTNFTHIGFTEDIKDTISYVREKYEGSKIILVGCSMGGNLVSLLLGRDRKDFDISDVIGGVGISIPFDFNVCAASKTYLKPLIDYKFLKHLKNFFEKNKKVYEQKFIEKIKSSVNVLELNKIISESLGYKDIKEYYDKNSSINYLKDIKTPLMVINAKNDFLLTSYFPEKDFEENKYLLGVVTSAGGHLGFQGYNLEFSISPLIEEFCDLLSRKDLKYKNN